MASVNNELASPLHGSSYLEACGTVLRKIPVWEGLICFFLPFCWVEPRWVGFVYPQSRLGETVNI